MRPQFQDSLTGDQIKKIVGGNSKLLGEDLHVTCCTPSAPQRGNQLCTPSPSSSVLWKTTQCVCSMKSDHSGSWHNGKRQIMH